MNEEICGNCKYSRSKVEIEEKGWMKKVKSSTIEYSCRFGPPSVNGWPSVEDSDWCGRFETEESITNQS